MSTNHIEFIGYEIIDFTLFCKYFSFLLDQKEVSAEKLAEFEIYPKDTVYFYNDWKGIEHCFSIFELNSSYGDEIEKVGSEKDVNSYLQESPEEILTRETTKREKAKNAIEEFKTWCLKYITVENFNLIFKLGMYEYNNHDC